MKYICMCTLIFLFSCSSEVYRKKLPEILGVANVEIESSSSTDEFGGFGQGFATETYTLSESTINTFIKNWPHELPDHAEGNRWNKYGWSGKPISKEFEPVITLALGYTSGGEEMTSLLTKIKASIDREGIYYSFYYRPEDINNPRSVILFVLDKDKRTLYVIDSAA